MVPRKRSYSPLHVPFAMRKKLGFLHVRTHNARAQRGILIAGALHLPCMLGRNGLSYFKKEGDGTTPAGLWPLRQILYRSDQIMRPTTPLKTTITKSQHGWCDAADDRNYNRRVPWPYPNSAEHLYRSDRLYDIIIVLGHNDQPRCRSKGSAVFVHLSLNLQTPTAGCIAISLKDMRKLLAYIGPKTRILIWPPNGSTPHVLRRSPTQPEYGWRQI